MADLVWFPRRRLVTSVQADRAYSIAIKIQRLCLDYPMEAEEVEKLLDRILSKHAEPE